MQFQEAPQPGRDESQVISSLLEGKKPDTLILESIAPKVGAQKELKISDLFRRISEDKAGNCVSYSPREFAVLVDLQLIKSDALRTSDPTLNEIETEIEHLKERSGLINFAGPVWNSKLNTLRQLRIDHICEIDPGTIANAQVAWTSQNDVGTKDPVRAKFMYSVLKKLGNYDVDSEMLMKLADSNTKVLQVFNNLLDHMSCGSISSQAMPLLKELDKVIQELGFQPLTYKSLQYASKRNIDKSSIQIPDIGIAVGGGAAVLGAAVTSAAAGAALTLPILSVPLMCGTLVGMIVHRWCKESEFPFVGLARKLRRKEALGLVSANQGEIEDKIDFIVSKNPKAKAPAKVKSEKLLTISEQIPLIKNVELKDSLSRLLEEKQSLERTLTAIGYEKIPSTLSRAFILLDNMLARYSTFTKEQPRISHVYARKVLSSSEAIRKHVKSLNEGMKRSIEREFAGNAEAIKSILAPLEGLAGEESDNKEIKEQ